MSEEDISAALAGRTVITNGNKIVLNFRKTTSGSPATYVGEVDGKSVFFNRNGESTDGTIKLSLASTTITNKGTQGDEQTRTEDEAAFVMNSLNFKEQVALRCLASIVTQEPNPLGYDDSKIKLLVSAAFRLAVEFQNRAMMFRKEEEGGGGSGDVEVDTDSLADNTEKLLYNLVNTLKEGVAIQGSGTVDALPLSVNINRTPVEETEDTISIKAAIFETKYIRFRFTNHMAYSDVSVYVECNVKEGEVSDTRKCGFILHKGTVVTVEELDEKVTEIVSISSVAVRGQDVSDSNEYTISTETI